MRTKASVSTFPAAIEVSYSQVRWCILRGMQSSFSAGECVEYGWNEFKKRPASYVLTTFVAMLLTAALHFAVGHLHRIGFLLSLVFFPVQWICMASVAHKGLSGAEPTLNDVVRPFTERQGDYLMVALAMMAGAIACVVGAVASWYLCAFAPIYVLEGRDFKAAVLESKDLVLKYPGEVGMILVVVVALHVAGVLACGVGTLVTTPIAMLALAKAHEQLRRPGILPAEAPSPNDSQTF